MADVETIKPTFGKGRSIPKRKGGAQAIPNPFLDMVDEMRAEVDADGFTTDGNVRTAEFEGVADRKDTNVNRAWRQFSKAAEVAGFKPGRQWDVENKGTAAKPKVVGVMTFWFAGKREG
jgi:hypothetical protein